MPAPKSEQHLTIEQVRAQADALFNSIGDGAIATDEFGKITRINPAALKILGFTKKELLGTWFPRKIVAVDDQNVPLPLIERPISKAFLSGETASVKTYYRRKNDTIVPVAVTVSPIILKGRPIGAIEVFRDITVEFEIDRMKSEFISLASHQLRTPLSAVKTYSHMLLDGFMGELNESQRKSLLTVVIAANRMNELISTLLNITRIESGSITVAPKDVGIQHIAEEVIKELQHTANAKNIALSLDVHCKDSTVHTDVLILKEIITNLVSNAIKYTPDNGSVIITLSTKGKWLITSVKDSGLGIPRESQEQIFTKFYRAQNVVRRETSGTGLGLYLVKGLTEQLGGKIWFESEENKGSTFYLSLPRTAAKAHNAPVKTHKRSVTSEA